MAHGIQNTPQSLNQWLYVGSAVTASAALGVVLLKMAGVVTFTTPFLSLVVSSVAMRIFSEISLNPSTWTMSDDFIETLVPRIIDFHPLPEEGQGSIGVYPVVKENFRQKYQEKLNGMTHEDPAFKQLMVKLLKNHIEKPSKYSKIIFNRIAGIEQLIEQLPSLLEQEAERENLFDAFVGKDEVLKAYLSAALQNDYYFSNEELEFMAELAPAARVVPILNPSVNCFMNAVFQVVMQDERLKNALRETYKDEDSPKAKALIEAIEKYGQGKLISSYALRQFMPEGYQLGQQDATEFFHALMNRVDAKKYPELFQKQTINYYWEKKNDEGSVTSSATSNVEADELDAFLEVPYSDDNKAISGSELILNHFAMKKNVLEKGGWIDDKTKIEYTEGQQQVQIEGKRITFGLKRFNMNQKICTPVDMPEKWEHNGKNYVLKKIITHHGLLRHFGHYTSLLKIEGKWIKTDDMRISEVESSTEDRLNGYMFFYEEETSE